MVRLSILTLALATTAFAHAQKDRTFDRTLSTSNSPNVSISTGSGFIHLHPGSDSQIKISGHVRANRNGWFGDSSSDADRHVNEIADHPPIQQTATTS